MKIIFFCPASTIILFIAPSETGPGLYVISSHQPQELSQSEAEKLTVRLKKDKLC